jgi:signal transduction histidine kinase
VENATNAYKESAEQDVLRPRYLIAGATVIGAALTVLVVAVPALAGGHRSLSLHIAIETAASLIALLAAYLVFGRFQQNALLSDLTLVVALTIFGLTNILFRTVPAVVSGEAELDGFALWAPICGALAGAFIFALAALAPEAPVGKPARYVVVSLLVAMVSFGVLAAAAGFAQLDSWDDVAQPPPGRPELFGDAGVSAAHFVAGALFIIAAVGFSRRGKRDDFILWFAAAAVLAAFSRFSEGLFPSDVVGWVQLADALRLGVYALVLIGAAREIRGYWAKFAEAAILEERRRIARDLHDGLAQELAYVVSQAHRAKRQSPGEIVDELSIVAQRALDDSRRAIAALVEPLDQPIEIALEHMVEEVFDRTGVPIELSVPEGIQVDPVRREALLRIVREAVLNAARHSDAHAVTVRLSNDGHLHVEVSDDGVGFDADAARRDRFGLISMKERAQALGAEFRIDSDPGAGTTVEVVFR